MPFYFAPRSPMMYRIACDCRDAVVARYQGGDRPLIFLAARLGAIVDAGLAWVATDGNAAAAISRFTIDLAEADRMIDWPLMYAQQWNDSPDDQDRQRRRMAELLVHGEVPLSMFHQVGAYDEVCAERARLALGDHLLAESIIVRAHWYYGYERR